MSAQNGNKRPRRGTRPGSIRQVRLRLWWAIEEASGLLDDDDKETKMRAISALSTASGVYAKLTEAQDFERQLEELRKELDEVRQTLGRPQSAGASAQGPAGQRPPSN